MRRCVPTLRDDALLVHALLIDADGDERLSESGQHARPRVRRAQRDTRSTARRARRARRQRSSARQGPGETQALCEPESLRNRWFQAGASWALVLPPLSDALNVLSDADDRGRAGRTDEEEEGGQRTNQTEDGGKKTDPCLPHTTLMVGRKWRRTRMRSTKDNAKINNKSSREPSTRERSTAHGDRMHARRRRMLRHGSGTQERARTGRTTAEKTPRMAHREGGDGAEAGGVAEGAGGEEEGGAAGEAGEAGEAETFLLPARLSSVRRLEFMT